MTRSAKRNDGHDFYVHLVRYLAPIYPALQNDKLEQLSACSYGYFKFLLTVDKWVDNPQSFTQEASESVIKSILHFEEIVKNLAFLFPKDDPFWHHFATYKVTYVKANLLEKQISLEKGVVTEEQFTTLAVGKSVLCFAIIDALNSLSGNHANTDSLKECIKHFHIAFQFRDDLDDFKQDLEINQYTYIQSLLRLKLAELSIDDNTLSPEVMHKYLFLTGVAATSLLNAINHYKISKLICNRLALTELENYIDRQINDCETALLEIGGLITKSKLKSARSNELLKVGAGNEIVRIQTAMNTSLSFLDTNIGNNGLWQDFLTSKGVADHWITAYAGMMLGEVAASHEMSHVLAVKKVLEKVNYKNLRGAYNDKMIEDGDSLSFLVAFQTHSAKAGFEGHEWLTFQDGAGGWRTYNDAKLLQRALGVDTRLDVSGWLSSKTCVTAVACYVLSSIAELQREFNSTSAFLNNNQQPDGSWKSYWWSHDVYATSWSVMALSKRHDSIDACKRACEWITQKQGSNGAWSTKFDPAGSALFTALALKSLLVCDAARYKRTIAQGVEWILCNQMADGSWNSSYTLRVPGCHISNPEEVNKWSMASFGHNIVTDDFNRVFTTSTVFNLLSKCIERKDFIV